MTSCWEICTYTHRVNLFIKFCTQLRIYLAHSYICRLPIRFFADKFSWVHENHHLSVLCISLEWKPLVEPVYLIILYCRSYFQFATLTLQLLLSVSVGEDIFVRMEFLHCVFVMNNSLFELFVFHVIRSIIKKFQEKLCCKFSVILARLSSGHAFCWVIFLFTSFIILN